MLCLVKRCRQCSIDKPVADFSRDSTSPDGRQRACKACKADYWARRKAISDGGGLGECRATGCQNGLVSRGLCNKHLYALRAGREVSIEAPNERATECGYSTCALGVKARGFCSGHYQQLLRFGGDQSAMHPLRAVRSKGSGARRNESGEKQCSRCHAWKAEGAFVRSAKSVDGLSSSCSRCIMDARYGLSPGEHDAILEAQGGLCAICKLPGNSEPLCIDHDHSCCPGHRSCGECVRGLLCQNCNKGLAHMMDDIGLLVSAVEYLSRGK